MFDPGTPHQTRRARWPLTLAAFLAFTLTAGAMVAGLKHAGNAEAAPAAAQPAAAQPAAMDHAAMATTDPASAPIDAPKNTNPADVPAYRPGVQVINWDMTEKVVEIAPGKVVKVWTFGDRVPGPVARVRVGDLVKVTINNKTTMPHSIDFHAARIAPDKAFTDVMPGKSWSFEFTATTPGVFMYHCGTAPVVHHIANGMYGMIIVEPEGGLPKVDREIALVQSDFYVSDTPGMPADDAKLMTGIPDVVAFNGYAAQYKDDPIIVNKGEEIRVFLLDAGPNSWSAFHVVGTIFDRAWIDGIHPENLSIGNQTLNLAASQGAVAEFRLDEEGVYPFVSHDFTAAAKGAVGLFKTAHATGTMNH